MSARGAVRPCAVPEGAAHRARRRLAKVLASHCRGRLLLRGDGAGPLAGELAELGLRPTVGGEGRFDTVLLAHALDRGPDGERQLEEAWRGLAPQGRLVVCAPNPDATAGSGSRGYTLRRLRHRLRALGEPRLVSTQPFRWLVMYVDRERPLPGPVRERYRVITELCHGGVLELGCGRGRLVAAIARAGLPVRGIELNAEKVALGLERCPELDLRQGDILELSPRDGRYDTVVLAEVIEHVAEDVGARMLDRAWALVAPGGRLIVSVPNEDLVPHRNHLTEFDARSLASRLRSFGEPTLVVDQPLKWLLAYVDRPT